MFTASGNLPAALGTPSPFGIDMANNTAGPELFTAVTTGTNHARACIMMTANATGGIATEWIQSYWLLRDVTVSSLQSQIVEPPGYLQISLTSSASLVAFFATPSGGVLGARTQTSYDFPTHTPWAAWGTPDACPLAGTAGRAGPGACDRITTRG